jgi:hypothetical protein
MKYVEGAIPGKRVKLDSNARQKKSLYEDSRPPRKFSSKWKEGRPWLTYDEPKNAMSCSI